jgi:neutral ceramidase
MSVQIQRYEGASTIYGPHTHAAYLDQYKKLTRSIFKVRNWFIKFF